MLFHTNNDGHSKYKIVFYISFSMLSTNLFTFHSMWMSFFLKHPVYLEAMRCTKFTAHSGTVCFSLFSTVKRTQFHAPGVKIDQTQPCQTPKFAIKSSNYVKQHTETPFLLQRYRFIIGRQPLLGLWNTSLNSRE